MRKVIPFPIYEKCYPTRLKKFFQSNLNCTTYDKYIPYVKRPIVGNLPGELINFFPKETRANDVKEFQNALAEITEYLRASYEKNRRSREFRFYDINYRQTDDVKNWMKETSFFFNMLIDKISGGGQFRADFKYIEHGNFGNVYQFSLTDKNGNKIMHDKALKVFFYKNEPDFNDRMLHGNFSEANFWTYIKHMAGHTLDKTQFTNHYISDMKSGYALTDFADENIPKVRSKIEFFKIFHVFPNDGHRNREIFNKIYDVGGFEAYGDHTCDKMVIRYLKKLYNQGPKQLPEFIARLKNMAQNPKNEHRTKIKKAIDLFEQQKRIDNTKL